MYSQKKETSDVLDQSESPNFLLKCKHVLAQIRWTTPEQLGIRSTRPPRIMIHGHHFTMDWSCWLEIEVVIFIQCGHKHGHHVLNIVICIHVYRNLFYYSNLIIYKFIFSIIHKGQFSFNSINIRCESFTWLNSFALNKLSHDG
jgi:hypothetical protein